MPTQEELNALWKEYQAARDERIHDPYGLQRRENELYHRYILARDELEAQDKAARLLDKANRKEAFKAEFKAAKDKRPLRELVADESVVGTFKGWQFATKTGVELFLRPIHWLTLEEQCTWEELRILIAASGWPRFWYGMKQLEGFRFIRVSDQSERDFAVDNVVAWRLSNDS